MLKDLSHDISLEELKTLLSLEHGESMTLYIRRADDKVISNYSKIDRLSLCNLLYFLLF